MADEIKIKAPSVEQNINVNVTGEAEIHRLYTELQAAQASLDRVNSTLQHTENELANVRSQFDNFAHGNGIDILTEEVNTLRAKVNELSEQALYEFRNILQSMNINPSDLRFDDLFNDIETSIKNGEMTASQAIMHFKSNFRSLIEESYEKSGGLLDTQMIQEFTASLEKLANTVQTVVDRLNSIEQNGVKAVGGSGGGDVANVLSQIENAARGMSEEVKGSYESITSLVNAMNEYANLDSTRILGVSQAFRNIADIGKGSYGTKSIENIVHLTKQLQALSTSGSSIRFDFTGFNDLNVSKASVSNLATYLPQIASVDVSKLEKLSQVNLTNFNNVKVSKSAIENISRLTEAIQVLKEVKAASVSADEKSIDVSGLENIETNADSASSAIDRVASSVNTMVASLDESKVSSIVDTLKTIDGIDDKGAVALAKSISEVGVTSGKVKAKVEELKDGVQSLISLSVNGKNANGDTLSYIFTYDKKTQEVKKTLLEVGAAWGKVEQKSGGASKKTSGISEEAKAAKKSFDDATDAINEFYSLQIKVAKLGTDIKYNKDDKAYTSKSGAWIEYARQLTNARRVYSELTSEEKQANFTEQQRAEIISLLTGRVNELNLALEEQRNKASTKTKTHAEDSEMSADKIQINLLKIDKLRESVKTTIQNAGELGVDSDSLARLKELSAELDALRANTANGSVTNQDFANSFTKIRLAADIAGASIKGETNTIKTILKPETAAFGAAQQELSRKMSQAKDALTGFTAAKNSNNLSSRNAYTAIQNEYKSYEQLTSKLHNGKMYEEDFATAVKRSSGVVAENIRIIKENGDAHKTTGEKIQGAIAKFSQWFSVTRIVMAAYRMMKQMVSAVIEVDTAMTELRKVTEETEATYDKFLENATVRARNLGATLADTVNATADFARLGYTLEEAEQLSDAAIIYKNVGDGIEDIGTASESIISTMKAFSDELPNAEDAILVVDKFNEVGNNFAISSKGVGDALVRSASAMHAANNTLDETIALITTANTVVQNPDSVGTAMKTLSMYLRAAKTEAEEAGESTEGMANSVSELREDILDLTGGKVDIQIDEDTFKSTYQIIKELSEVWQDLRDVSQANILEMLGGKRNANVVSALIENFEVAEKVMEASANAAGSATAENEKFLDSIQGHINQLKASFETFSQSFIDGDLVKFVVDVGTTILDLLNGVTKVIDALGGLKTVLLAVASVLLITKGELIGVEVQMLAVAAVKKLLTFFMNVKAGLLKVVNIIPTAITAWKGYAAGTVSASAAMQASIPVIGLVLAAITALVGALSLYSSKSDEAVQKSMEEARAAAELSDDISGLTYEYLALSDAVTTDESDKESLLDTQDKLLTKLSLEKDKIEELTKQYGSYTDAIKAASIEKLKDEERTIRGGLNDYEDALKKAAKGHSIANKSTNHLISSWSKSDAEANRKALQALVDAGYISGGSFGSLGTEIFLPTEGYDLSSVDGIVASYERLGKMLDIIADTSGSNIDVYKDFYAEYQRVTEALNQYDDAIGNLNTNLAEQYALDNLIGKEIPTTKDAFDKYRQEVIDSAVASKEFIGSTNDIEAAVDGVLRKQSQFVGFYRDVASAADNAGKMVNTVEGILSKVNALSSGLNELDKIYADIYNKADFDWSSILDNEAFTNAFSGLDKLDGVYSKFIETVANSPTNIAACQEAFDNLTTAYLKQSGILDNVTDATRNATVAMLEQMGIANAAAIVDAKLAYEKEKLVYTTSEYTEKTYEELSALYEEAEAGTTAKQILAELALEKALTNENEIKTSDDIERLENLATAANATRESLNNLAEAKLLIMKAEEWEKNSALPEYDRRMISQGYYRQAQEVLNRQLSYEKPSINYSGGSSSRSAKESAAKESEDKSKTSSKEETWFEKQYKLHKHMLEMEQESEEEYLTWLDSAYKKADEEGILSTDDLYRYQEEVFKGFNNLKKAGKQIDEYVADVDDYYEATKKLESAEHIREEIETDIKYADRTEDKIKLTRELISAYGDEYNATENIVALRKNAIENNIQKLEELGFQIQFNSDANELYISNTEHLNELQADSVGEYESLQEATNALRKDTENLIDTVEELNEKNRDDIKSARELQQSVSEAKKDIISYLNDIVKAANDMVDGFQEVYSTLTEAAKEYSDNGYLSVDSLQKILELSPKYLSMLANENGQLVISEQTLRTVIAAKTDELGAETALAYAKQILLATERGEIQTLISLADSSAAASGATWDMAYATVGLARAIGTANKIDAAYYDNAVSYISKMQSLTKTAVDSVSAYYDTINDSTKESLKNQQDGLDTILKMTEDLIKHENEGVINALEDQKDAYSDIIEQKKKLIKLAKEEDDHNSSINDKLKKAAKLQAQIAALSLDDSRSAQAEKRALEEELAELQGEITDEQTDYYVDAQIDALDSELDAFNDTKDAEIDELRNSLSSTEKLYQAAISRISNNWDTLYNDLLAWNYEYGTTLQSDLTSAWDSASEAVQRYGSYLAAVNGVAAEIDASNSGLSSGGYTLGEYTDYGSGTYGSAANIITAMRNNSLNWWGATDSERESLDANNLALAEQYRQLSGENIYRNNGTWYHADDSVLYTVDKDEIARNIVSKMENNSALWSSANDESTRKILESENERLAKNLSSLLGASVTKDSGGTWWVDGKKLYSIKYHSGGIVGGNPTLKQNEVMAILEKGEAVLDEEREKGLYKIIDFVSVLSEKLGTALDESNISRIFNSAPSIDIPNALASGVKSSIGDIAGSISGNGNYTIERIDVTAPISVVQKLDSDDIKEHAKMIGAISADYIKNGFTKRGISTKTSIF